MMLLVSSILAALIVGLIGLVYGRIALREAAFALLTEVRESQSRALEEKIADLKNHTVVYARAPGTVAALDEFSAAFDGLSTATIDPAQQQALVNFYDKQLIGPTEETTGVKLDPRALLPTTNAQRHLQAFYTAPFTSPDDAMRVDDAHDGTPWTAAHARHHDFFRQIVARFGYGDALLINNRGDVVYAARKGADLGTNILTGPFRETNLRQAYDEAMASNQVDYVAITDIQNYQPAGDRPTAWMVTTIGNKGALALQFPVEGLNRFMTFDRQWRSAGLGTTGETYLAGPDDLMRSDSRLFLEDTERFKRAVVEAGTPVEVADKAIRLGTTILLQPTKTDAVDAAQRGGTGTLIADDYLGHRSLQAYAPVELSSSLRWSIIAKVDTSEAFASMSTFTRTLVLYTAGIILAVCVAAMILARMFVRPIHKLEAGAQRISDGEYDVVIPVESRDEFGDLTVAFNEMSRNLNVKEQLLNEQRRENEHLLLSLMPEPVVQRYREGEQNIAQDHQDVTVIFADLLGLDELFNEFSSEESLAILNELLRQFDAAADSLGIERVHTLRNGYLASCGLNVPRLDNVRRTVDFALEMQLIVDRFNSENDHDLRLRAGIDAGAATSGLVGQSNLYDLWGNAVSIASRVQRAFPQPGAYVTSRVYEVMRDTRRFTSAGTISVGGTEEQIWRLSENQP